MFRRMELVVPGLDHDLGPHLATATSAAALGLVLYLDRLDQCGREQDVVLQVDVDVGI